MSEMSVDICYVDIMSYLFEISYHQSDLRSCPAHNGLECFAVPPTENQSTTQLLL